MPPANPRRRRTLADAAVALIATSGVHGLSHRGVEQRAAVPPGTASNYFRTRESLLVAAAERVVELHLADMTRIDRRLTRQGPDRSSNDGIELVVDMLTESLHGAATTQRTRYLAIFELQLEARRTPAVATVLRRLVEDSTQATVAHHVELGLAVSPEKVPLLITLYGGALYTLVTAPLDQVTVDGVRQVAAAIVRGALTAAPATP